MFPRFQRFQKSPVLSPSGFAAAALAFFILVRSLVDRNAYGIALASAVLCVWALLGFAGVWGARRLKDLEPLWKPLAPAGAKAAEDSFITGLDCPLPWFFRLHFVVRGRFFAGGGSLGRPVASETSVPRGSGTARLALSFPMSGIFHGEGGCRLRDILGFFSFPCGRGQSRSFPVRSAPCLTKPFRVEAHSGAEDRRNKSSADEERYYMREYAPGDRFRDINWKSSERIDTLITRISPDNQEKVSRIAVYFRNYCAGALENSLEDLWLLDRAKARLAQFLRAVKEGEASYIFQVSSARKSWDITDMDELEKFLDELAGLPFVPSRNEDRAQAEDSGAAGDLYVFSTACDRGLPAFLLTRHIRHLFFVRPPAQGTSREEIERISIRDFAENGFLPSPRWLLPTNREGKNLQVPPVPATLDYAEAGW